MAARMQEVDEPGRDTEIAVCSAAGPAHDRTGSLAKHNSPTLSTSSSSSPSVLFPTVSSHHNGPSRPFHLIPGDVGIGSIRPHSHSHPHPHPHSNSNMDSSSSSSCTSTTTSTTTTTIIRNSSTNSARTLSSTSSHPINHRPPLPIALSSDSSRNDTKAESASSLTSSLPFLSLSTSTSSSLDSPDPRSLGPTASTPTPLRNSTSIGARNISNTSSTDNRHTGGGGVSSSRTLNNNSRTEQLLHARSPPSQSPQLPALPSLTHSKPDPLSPLSSFSSFLPPIRPSRTSLQSKSLAELQQQHQQLQLHLQRQLHLAMHQNNLKNARSMLTNSLEKTSESFDQHSDTIASQPSQSTSSPPQDPAPPRGDCASQNCVSIDPTCFCPASLAEAPHPSHQANPSFKSTILPMVSQAPDLPFPSVLELSLTLSTDIEIHRLWKTITEILSQKFFATKITLCLPQDPTVVSSSIENNLHQTRPWGLKAHWDYKQHFLDENTVTPKDEFAHHHHRLQKSASLSQDDPSRSSLRLPVSTIPLTSSSSSSFSSTSSSSSFSRRRAAHTNSNGFNIDLGNHYHHHGYTNNDSYSNSSSNSGVEGIHEGRKYVPIPDSKAEYHEDYWNTNPPLDGGYSSSTSAASSYSSASSSVMQASRAAADLRGFGIHSSGTECFANLQSLEYDPEPLLNEHTIDSILRAGKTVVLTREYVGSKGERRKGGRMRSFLSVSAEDEDDSSFTDAEATDDRADLGDVEINGADGQRLARAIRTGAGFSFGQDAGSGMH
ncbi:MAG: hypothetical protein J3Q66DRAFT_162810 [Benniella sp.]|nr:MAG: hypothetical protein J3Q66DRAFT_162810 [Benniella sp.]